MIRKDLDLVGVLAEARVEVEQRGALVRIVSVQLTKLCAQGRLLLMGSAIITYDLGDYYLWARRLQLTKLCAQGRGWRMVYL